MKKKLIEVALPLDAINKESLRRKQKYRLTAKGEVFLAARQQGGIE